MSREDPDLAYSAWRDGDMDRPSGVPERRGPDRPKGARDEPIRPAMLPTTGTRKEAETTIESVVACPATLAPDDPRGHGIYLISDYGPPPLTLSRHIIPPGQELAVCCLRASIVYDCTCAYRTVCPVHGTECHGTHE